MKTESEKYDKIISLLRKSKPELDSTEDIEKEVIKRISKENRSGVDLSELIDFLFRWAYIGWVRRSLITASIALIMIFVYQQGVILKRIDKISRQVIVSDKELVPTTGDKIEKLLMVYKNSGRKFPSKTITISESQMKELLESVKDLQIKYKDLEELIEGDPELKKLIEQKITDSNRTKINL
jgi:hypothetical protein